MLYTLDRAGVESSDTERKAHLVKHGCMRKNDIKMNLKEMGTVWTEIKFERGRYIGRSTQIRKDNIEVHYAVIRWQIGHGLFDSGYDPTYAFVT